MGAVKPLQRLSYTEKIKDNNAWGKESIDYYLDSSDIVNNSTRRDRLHQWYNIYNNIVPESWFNYVTNPLNSKREEYRNFPAKIRPYNIILPNINLYIGEYIKRLFKWQVLNKSEEGYNNYVQAKADQLHGYLASMHKNRMIEAGAMEGEVEEIPPPDEFLATFEEGYQDTIARKGAQSIKEAESRLRIRETLKRVFTDFIISGEAHTYKDVERSDLIYERVNPIDKVESKSPDHLYGEDGDWAVRRKYASISDVVDKFYDELTEDQHQKLEDERTVYSSPLDLYTTLSTVADKSRDKLFFYHVTWKSEKKVGILTYTDEFGQPAEMEVDEDYKVDKKAGESVKWMWVNEWWEGYRIDKDIYLRIRPVPIQRNELNNSSKCKGLHNSVYFSNENSENTSIVNLGIPYLVMFIILNYRIELLVAKSKGKIALLDLMAIPNQGDWDEEKFMYYGEAVGYGFLNRNQVGVDKSWNQYTSIDLSQMEHISQLIQLKNSYKQDYDELLGISRQRKAQVSASDTVGGTEQAIVNSTVMSEFIFSKFDDFKRTEYEGLLDMLKFAYIDGKKSLYLKDDVTHALLDIEPEDFLHSELGVFISNDPQDFENLKILKNTSAQAFAQNGASPSTTAEVLMANSMAEIKHTLKKIEKKEMAMAQQQAASEQEGEQAMEALKKEFMQYEKMLETDFMEAEQDRLDNREYIKGDIELSKVGLSDADADGVPDINDIENRALQRQAEAEKRRSAEKQESLKEKELALKEKEIKTKASTDKYKADTSLKIAKENKNKHDK